MYVYRLDKWNRPLDPVTPAKARVLLKSDNWFVKKREPFTIKEGFVKGIDSPEPPEEVLRKKTYDIGLKFNHERLACTVVDSDTKKIVYQSLTDTSISNMIKKGMKQRANYRRTRRNRKTRYRKPRFDNRTRKSQLNPTMQHKLHNIIKELNFAKKILNIGSIVVEGVSYDVSKVSNPDYWVDTSKAVYRRDNYKCQVCKGKSKDFRLEAHHIIPRNEGGSDEVGNVITSCKSCHVKIHQRKIDVSGKKINGKLKASSYTQKLHLLKLLDKEYPDIVFKFGSVVTQKRRDKGLKYNIVYDSALLVTDKLKSDIVYFKKNLSLNDTNLIVKKQRPVQTAKGKVKGLLKFDKVNYHGIVGYVKGRIKTGYGVLMDVTSKKIDTKGLIGKSVVKLDDCVRLSARRSWISCMIFNSSTNLKVGGFLE